MMTKRVIQRFLYKIQSNCNEGSVHPRDLQLRFHRRVRYYLTFTTGGQDEYACRARLNRRVNLVESFLGPSANYRQSGAKWQQVQFHPKWQNLTVKLKPKLTLEHRIFYARDCLKAKTDSKIILSHVEVTYLGQMAKKL